MKVIPYVMLFGVALSAHAVDDVVARKNFGNELAGCSAYYGARANAPGLSKEQHDDFVDKSRTALVAASKVTDSEFAMTHRAQAAASPEMINGAVCDQVMAHPNERFAYWRGH